MRTDLHRRLLLALIVVLACSRTPAPALSQTPPSADASLGKLVAPIALYPDPLVAQILPASTQPVQVVEAARAVAAGARPDQDTASQWDPSVQALLSFPTVLKMMNDKLEWTTRLGQAVVANQGAVMAAIQQVRQQAQAAGNLQSNAQQAVQTQGSTIVIEPANPQYIYVPQYDPVAILAPAPYYAYAAPLMTFGVGFAAGAATAYACDWGRYGGYGSITVNNNYHYNYSNSYETYHSGTGSYTRYDPATGSSATYHSATGTYTGYDARTGTYGAYNPSTGKYGTYNPSTGAYDKSGSTGTYHPPSSSGSDSHGAAPEGGWGGRSNWGSDGGSGGDAFHGLGGGGWGARDASNRGFDSGGGRNFGGEGSGGAGFGGGFHRDGGGFGGGGFGGFRGGGFGGRR